MMKKIKLFSILIISLMLCACSNEKLYTEKEVINYLNNHYGAEFVVLESNKITRDEIQYKVALKKEKSIVFTITNELIVTGSDIGPKRNFLHCNEISNYYGKILKKYIDEFNDYRITIDSYSDGSYDTSVKVDFSKFTSREDLANSLFEFKKYYESKGVKFDVYAHIYNSDDYVGLIVLSNNSEINLDIIKNKLEEIL